MKLFNKKYLTGWMTVIILGLTLGIGCDDPYGNRVDFSKLQAEEAELRMDMFTQLKDSLMETSIALVDSMDDKGWAYFELENGSSDSVRVGKRVSFKYTYHYVLRDEESGEPRLTTRYTNVGTESLATYTVGAVRQQDTEVLSGVDRVIRYMSLYGKSYILMSHSLAFNDYYPVVAEIEIVSIDLD